MGANERMMVPHFLRRQINWRSHPLLFEEGEITKKLHNKGDVW
jgi:hypothetical protein